MIVPTFLRRLLVAALLVLVAGVPEAVAQRVVPPVRTGPTVVRGYVPPGELVSFLPTTPMDEFIRLVNPVFVRVTGKRVVDPEDRTDPIGLSLNGVHFVDAFELVLDRMGLDFRETDSYFIIQPLEVNAVTTDGQSTNPVNAGPTVAGAPPVDLPANADSREIRIDAIIFELNRTRARELGTNWAALFAQAQGAAAGGTGGTGGGANGGTGGTVGVPQLFLRAGSFFDALDGFLESSTDRVELGFLFRLFRWFEDQGYGQTIATPSVTVQSGIQGRFQSGEDLPVNITDFQGNTITSFVSTGVIVDVTPTLIRDERVQGDGVEFVHLNVKVEKSTSRITPAGPAVLKNDVNTQLVMLSGEQRAIGGLTSTEESFSRRGVPVLRDIPVLNYFFSYRQRTQVQKELVIVLQARVVDDLRTRRARPLPSDLLRQERQDMRERLDTLNPGAGQRYQSPEEVAPIEIREARVQSQEQP